LCFAFFGLPLHPNYKGMRVLVVTETDACCGPMAAAFLNDYSTSMEAVSAGRHPAQSVDALTVVVMHECFADLSAYQPRGLESLDPSDFDAVYECPEGSFPATVEEARSLRDYIKNEAYLFFCGLLRK